MSYAAALEAGGAEVHEIGFFGDYQGAWAAHVTVPGGGTGIIRGYYGSCSGCDAYEAACDYGPWDCDQDNPADPEECAAHKEKIAEFGRSYFDSLMTPEEAVQGWLEKDAEYIYGDDFEEIEFLLKFLPEDSPLRQQAADHIAKAKSRE